MKFYIARETQYSTKIKPIKEKYIKEDKHENK